MAPPLCWPCSACSGYVGGKLAGGTSPALYLAVSGAVLLALLLTHLLHEWGHFLGATLSASAYTLKPRPSPLFFDFDYEAGTARQYLWLSVGGLLGNLLALAVIALVLPLDTTIARSALAAGTALLAYVLVLELPISLGIAAGRPPMETLTGHFGQGAPLFLRATAAGLLVGALGSALILAAAP